MTKQWGRWLRVEVRATRTSEGPVTTYMGFREETLNRDYIVRIAPSNDGGTRFHMADGEVVHTTEDFEVMNLALSAMELPQPPFTREQVAAQEAVIQR